MRTTRIRWVALGAVAALLIAVAPASAFKSSLYTGPGHRPGPDLLYAKAASAPQLTNSGGWKARPILVSGAHAYRKGEYLYQDFLYDDHGAKEVADPADPQTPGDLFSKPNGTYTYPTDKVYANDAADLVEFRVKPLPRSTAFRVTLNTFKDRKLVAFAIALGAGNGKPRAFPFGANVKAPATLFLTVHPQGGKLVAVLNRARDGKTLKPGSTVRVDAKRRQITVKIPHRAWNPKHRTIRMAAGVGLWDAAAGKYLLPQGTASTTKPGGAGTASAPAAFFNVAFRGHEPRPSVTDNTGAVLDPAWWRDRAQGNALAKGDISSFSQQVKFGKLAKKTTDDRLVPKHGAMDRILPSHFERSQGVDFGPSCLTQQSTCVGQYQGQLQPYSIYIPHHARPAGGWGMTLLMHSLSANYNQYHGSHNQIQFGNRGGGSIVITPEARGPDEFYENYGAADVFDVWNDVARRYRLNPSWAVATGYSMGGYGTFKLASQFPDLFSRAQPTVGTENNTDVLASLRNVPVLMWNTHGDELVPEAEFQATAQKLDSLGYRYELDAFKPCTNAKCSPLFPSHLELAVNDQFAPAASFLGTSVVDRNPAHVTYVVDAKRNHANLSLVGDHAYWVSDVKLRDPSKAGPGGDPIATVDARSFGFGAGEPVASPLTSVGTGTLTGGNLGPLAYTRQSKSWTAPTPAPKANRLDVKLVNVASAVLDVKRARVGCSADVRVTSDGPAALTLAGCGRVVRNG